MAAPKKGPHLRKRLSRSSASINPDGEKPSEFLAHFERFTTKQRRTMFDQVTAASRINCKTFLANKEKARFPIPLHEKKRVVLNVLKEGDSDYFPATYACCERDDYVIMEAPTKANYRDYWRLVWRDGCKICVSLSDKLSDSDENLCYPYWPSKEGEKMQIDENRFEIECLKRNDMKGYVVYDLRITSTDPSLDTGMSKAVRGSKQKTDSREDDKNEEKKWRPLTLMHFEAWPSDTWPDLDLLGPFVHALSRREVQIMRQSVDSYVPPVVIQSHDGLGRGPVVWVSTILMKDIEKKECFDVEDLAKKCAKSRPGAFHKKIHFCVLLALAFRLASLGGWTALEDARTRMKDIQKAYEDSLKK
uniref:Tyrosine-protein phosphatase domain-containing protein n=1 Tax=Haemonchus contortus TaxID=6289 RepID=A0A7I4YKZ6_HAECO